MFAAQPDTAPQRHQVGGVRSRYRQGADTRKAFVETEWGVAGVGEIDHVLGAQGRGCRPATRWTGRWRRGTGAWGGALNTLESKLAFRNWMLWRGVDPCALRRQSQVVAAHIGARVDANESSRSSGCLRRNRARREHGVRRLVSSEVSRSSKSAELIRQIAAPRRCLTAAMQQWFRWSPCLLGSLPIAGDGLTCPDPLYGRGAAAFPYRQS